MSSVTGPPVPMATFHRGKKWFYKWSWADPNCFQVSLRSSKKLRASLDSVLSVLCFPSLFQVAVGNAERVLSAQSVINSSNHSLPPLQTH